MRETGPARKELSGDEASPYIGAARTLLGQLKSDMAFNQLLQGTRRKFLADGTLLFAASAFGQDTIRILAPAEPPPPGVTYEEFTHQSYQDVVETDYSYTNTATSGQRVLLAGNSYASRFYPTGAEYLIPQPVMWDYISGAKRYIPLLPGHEQGRVLGISGDGLGVALMSAPLLANAVNAIWPAGSAAGPRPFDRGLIVGLGATAGDIFFVAGGQLQWTNPEGTRTRVLGSAARWLPDEGWHAVAKNGQWIIINRDSADHSGMGAGSVFDLEGRELVCPVRGTITAISDTGVAVVRHGQDQFTASLWNVKTGQLVKLPAATAAGYGDGVRYATDISPDGRFVVGDSYTPANWNPTVWDQGQQILLEPRATAGAAGIVLAVDSRNGVTVMAGIRPVPGGTPANRPQTQAAHWTRRGGYYPVRDVEQPWDNNDDITHVRIAKTADPVLPPTEGTKGKNTYI